MYPYSATLKWLIWIGNTTKEYEIHCVYWQENKILRIANF